MKVELEKSFPMPAGTAVSWAMLQNIEGVAGCMPGAKITERIDDRHFKGTISVRVGPAGMSFRGEIEVRDLDATQRLLHLVGKGSDTTGSSGASMDLKARIEPGTAPGTSTLIGRSEVTLNGKAAAFGGRMMTTVADQILKQFAGNFAAEVEALATTSVPATAASAGDAVPSPDGSPPSIASTTAAPAISGSAAAPRAAKPPGTPDTITTLAPPRAQPRNDLNALSLLWAILRDWWRNLFRRKPA